MKCQRCGKRLSRKTARLIDSRVLCSTCMFAPLDALRDSRPAQVGRNPKGQDRGTGLGRNDEHAVCEADAPTPSGSDPQEKVGI